MFKTRHLLLLLVLALLPGATAQAQKYACVNTDYVLRSIPDYANALKRLDRYVSDWTEELRGKQAELDAMRDSYEQESYLLPDNLKKRRQEEIKEKEAEVKALQQQRFGAGGDLEKKQAELLRPVQERVYNTIERLAHEKNYAFVFDKAGSATVLFAAKKYDISDDVLELLGVKPGAVQDKGQDKGSSNRGTATPSNPEMDKSGRSSRDAIPAGPGRPLKR